MTAPSDGKLRDEYLANRAVPHMSQSRITTTPCSLRLALDKFVPRCPVYQQKDSAGCSPLLPVQP
jgi:hypothetical protein